MWERKQVWNRAGVAAEFAREGRRDKEYVGQVKTLVQANSELFWTYGARYN